MYFIGSPPATDDADLVSMRLAIGLLKDILTYLLTSSRWSGGPCPRLSTRPLLPLSAPGRRCLRSTERGVLIVPFARTATKQNRAFSVVGPSPFGARLHPRIHSESFYACL